MSSDKKYIYLNVLPRNYVNPLYFLGTEDIEPGDYVLVSLRDVEKVGLVLDAKEYAEEEVPYPINYMQSIIRKVSTDEEAFSKDFEKLEPERAKRFKTSSQQEKDVIKDVLEKTGVDRDKLTKSKDMMLQLLKSIPDQTEVLRDMQDALMDGAVLSDNKKMVIGFKAKKRGFDGIIKIPAGVEVIDDYALDKIRITSLFLPKELKELGARTIFGEMEYNVKCITNIVIEEGNEYYEVDEYALYKKIDGKRELVYAFNHDIREFTVPEDVVSVGDRAFYHCDLMTEIHLPESIETFDENCLSPSSKVEEIILPKGIKHLIPKPRNGHYEGWKTVTFRIDEECESIFTDEDSIYEVLDDGTYKLILNQYMGKGKPLILDNTSIIGREAFSEHHNMTTIELPKTIKVIEKYAFENSGLKGIDIPEGVERIEEGAFYECSELKKVYIPSSVGCVSEGAFRECYELNRIKSDKKGEFSIDDYGELTRKASKQVANNSLSNSGSKKEVPVVNKDFFDEYSTKLKDAVAESATGNEHAADRAIVNKDSRTISVNIAISQTSQNSELVKERVAAAESLSEGTEVNIVPSNGGWEVKSKSGKSIGEVGWMISRVSLGYMNRIELVNAQVTSVVPKSKRRSNAKYALVSIKFDIVERKLPEGLSNEDVIAISQFAYGVDNGEIKLVKWIGDPKTKKIVIPATIEGKPVVSLEYGLFESDYFTGVGMIEKLEELVISEGIKRLEANSLSYYEFEKLKLISLPASLEFIHNDVFTAQGMDFRDSGLGSKQVFVAPKGSYAEKFLKNYKPDSYDVKILKVVNDNSEDSQKELKALSAFEIEHGEYGIQIKFKASYMLDGFKEKIIAIPENINGEPLKVFDIDDIPGFVQKLIFPASVEKILHLDNDYLFYNSNQGICEIEIADDNTVYWSDGKSIFTKDKKTLLRYMSYQDSVYEVPEGTEKIAQNAFTMMKKLEKLVLPKTMKYIGSHAFYDCEKLADIEGLEYVSEVGEKIFAGDGWASGSSIPYEQNTPILIIGSTLLRYNKLSEKVIKIPDGITDIENSAFGWKNKDDNVEEIILPTSIKTIGAAAFCGRSKLKKINIPDGVEEIKRDTFGYCEALEELFIPASVKNIDIAAFPTYQEGGSYSSERKCALKSIVVDTDNDNYCSIDGMLLTKDKKELLFIPNGVAKIGFTIPNGVEKINDSLAYNNNTLKELVLPEGVVSIGKSAFSGCSNLEKVVLPDSVEIISEYAFNGCSNLSKIIWSNNLKSIEDRAFKDSRLVEVILPEGIEHLGEEAFAGTYRAKVTVPKSVKTLGWGVFSGTAEIEVYDTITPDARECSVAIDTCNGEPNSLVGYIGMGPAWAMWDCAANHRWIDYTITVKSAETDEIKYKVWMGADSSQRDYYCFLSSAWGKNATFDFKTLDEQFKRIRGAENKKQVAKYRLEYPVDLSDEYKKKYEDYLKKN